MFLFCVYFTDSNRALEDILDFVFFFFYNDV